MCVLCRISGDSVLGFVCLLLVFDYSAELTLVQRTVRPKSSSEEELMAWTAKTKEIAAGISTKRSNVMQSCAKLLLKELGIDKRPLPPKKSGEVSTAVEEWKSKLPEGVKAFAGPEMVCTLLYYDW